MNKFLCGIMLFAAGAASALDLTTNDGKVYKNVSISSVTPVGFDICYTPKGGGLAIREILFTDLSPAWQKKYHYNPKEAAAFTSKVEKLQKMRREDLEKQYKVWLAREEEEDNIEAAIYAKRLNVQLTSIRATPFGCVAYADAPIDSLTAGHYGKVLIMGLELDNGDSWAGNIYPAGYSVTVSEGNLPVYTPSLDQAVILSRSRHNTQPQK
ncbi:MAG: hypothetical protein PHQ27_02180 [Victivallales bacterium]|nr:hypothetical protein [Victivallales bacterium]